MIDISVDGSKVLDATATPASGNIVFTLLDITPPAASGNAVPGDVGNGNAGAYGEDDTLTINFSEGIKVSEITSADLGTTINLSGTGTSFGTGATIAATNPQITVDNIDSDVNGVYSLIPATDVASLSLTGDFDPQNPNIANTIDANKPVYSFTNSAGETWYLWARTGSGYHISKLDSTAKWFWEQFTPLADAAGPEDVTRWMQASGDASPVVAAASIEVSNFSVENLATQFAITLGSGTDVASGDTITIDANQILDGEDNIPAAAQTFSVPSVSAPTIASIAIPAGNYGSGDTGHSDGDFFRAC